MTLELSLVHKHFPKMAACCLTVLLAILCTVTTTQAQQAIERRQLEHDDYDLWHSITAEAISRDGNWVWFLLGGEAIDAENTLTIRNLKSGKMHTVARGTRATFTADSKFILYRITPDKKELKRLRKKKTKSTDLPKPIFQMLELATGELTTVANVTLYQLPQENSDWVALTLSDPTADDTAKMKTSDVTESYVVTPEGLQRPEKKPKLKKRSELGAQKKSDPGNKEGSQLLFPFFSELFKQVSAKEKKQELKKEKEGAKVNYGNPVMLINLNSGVRRTFPNVIESTFSKFGTAFAFATSCPQTDQTDEPIDGVHVVRLDDSPKTTQVFTGVGDFKNLAFNEKGSRLAFITNHDDYEAKTPTWALYLWVDGDDQSKMIAAEGKRGIPADWWVAPNSSQLFAENDSRLYFETAPLPESVLKERESANGNNEKGDEPEKAKLDVWHWQDPQLQPQQLLQARAERDRDYRAAYVFESEKIIQLATREVPRVSIDPRSISKLAVANTNVEYRKALSWDIPGFQDAWLINLDTGKRRPILEKVKWNTSISPSGEYVVWFDGEKKHWYAKSTANEKAKPVKMSKGIRYALQNELHDTPNLARQYGSAGWSKDDAFLVYDRYDIWELDPTGEEKPFNLTEGQGRKSEISFRYQRLDNEERTIDLEKQMVLQAFNRKSKASGYYALNLATEDDQSSLEPLIMLDESVSGLEKAKDADNVIFTRNTFRMCPDLWASDLKFKKISRVSDTNPQQDQFTWGTAEPVSWKATDGQKLDGILYKPDGFDPEKKYPLMVYFYERYSDDIHRYYAPAAGRSIINFSFYVSRGYVVFIPDIPYKTGQPGPSAANAILPGVDALVKKGFIDKDKIGMQGHSWGGYQTAYLVTQTDMFACAESGAPVSNMTSAYGGIRWGSGMSRMFQYERTQSRIGDDLWSARDKYIANSPVFFADKINTPLLILHNDEDGAVPWYQGIELFVALRRLEKPAWMLNYNGDPHWVMGQQNRRDFAIRMQQFFDHYLKDAPEPEWMAVGVPAVKKGKEFGLSLLEPREKEGNEKAKKEKQEMKKAKKEPRTKSVRTK